MSGVFRLRLTLEGETQISRAFVIAEEAMGDLAPAFKVIGQQVQAGVRGQFASQGARGGGERWTELRPSYRAWKNVHYPGRPMLVRLGGMKGAMLNPQSMRATGRGLIYEPRSGYAAYHQRGEGQLPQRRMVQLTAGDRRGWERVILQWIRHGEGRAAWPPALGV